MSSLPLLAADNQLAIVLSVTALLIIGLFVTGTLFLFGPQVSATDRGESPKPVNPLELRGPTETGLGLRP